MDAMRRVAGVVVAGSLALLLLLLAATSRLPAMDKSRDDSEPSLAAAAQRALSVKTRAL